MLDCIAETQCRTRDGKASLTTQRAHLPSLPQLVHQGPHHASLPPVCVVRNPHPLKVHDQRLHLLVLCHCVRLVLDHHELLCQGLEQWVAFAFSVGRNLGGCQSRRRYRADDRSRGRPVLPLLVGHYPRLHYPLYRSFKRRLHHAAIPSQAARCGAHELGANQVDPYVTLKAHIAIGI